MKAILCSQHIYPRGSITVPLVHYITWGDACTCAHRRTFFTLRFHPVNKKVFRSRDVVFLEDQTIEDIDKLESVESSIDDLVDLDPLDPPIVHDINEEVQTPHDDAAEDDVEPEIEGEQPPQESIPQTSLRRSTKEKQPSKKYS